MDKVKIIKSILSLLLLTVGVFLFALIHDKTSHTLSDYAKEKPETALKTAEPTATPKPTELPAVTESPAPTEDSTLDFYYETLSGDMKDYIYGVSYPADDEPEKIDLDYLRLVHVLYINFDGKPAAGELICNASIADDLIEIFAELYKNKYQIENICLVEQYKGDDSSSMSDNNTSCFNHRQIAGTDELSNHALGLAVDINPFYNPCVIYNADGSETVYPEGAGIYVDRSRRFAFKIDEEDLAYKLFTEHGFTWGGHWNGMKDYQHFEKVD